MEDARQQRTSRRLGCFAWLFIIPLVLILVSCTGSLILSRLFTEPVAGVVIDHEVKRMGSGVDARDYYFVTVRDEDGDLEVFVNHDDVWWAKFNSADVQAQLVNAEGNGTTIHFTATGLRVPLFSAFRNIEDLRIPE